MLGCLCFGVGELLAIMGAISSVACVYLFPSKIKKV